MDKKCKKCGEVKPLESFNQRSDRKDGRVSNCKDCHHKYAKKVYKNNKGTFIGRVAKGHKERRQFFYDLKDNKPCADCKVVHRYFALDYDHRDPSQKSFNVSQLIQWTNKEKILAEIAKCDLICSNCHRYRTFKRKMQV